MNQNYLLPNYKDHQLIVPREKKIGHHMQLLVFDKFCLTIKKPQKIL